MIAQTFSSAMLLSIFLFTSLNLHGITGDYGGWQNAHATFYGGGDASGTMGECCTTTQLLTLTLFLSLESSTFNL